jgi:DNA-dependent RNA polymerase auxiliary subunit epsilon
LQKREIVKTAFVGIVTVLFFNIILNYSRKFFIEETYNINFIGVLNNKYLDKNDHNRAKIEILSMADTIIYDLQNDANGLYDFLSVGDSIVKTPNSFEVHVYNLTKDTIFKLDF